MKIDCPHCDKENQLDALKTINCVHCNQSFSGHEFISWKTCLGIAGVTLLLAIWGTHKVIDFVNGKRYPTHQEYILMNQCMSIYS